jgi:hypothetical protein
VEAIDAGYAADCVDLWFPLDDYHLYFTRLDLGDLYERTTGYYGDLWSFTTEELRNWLARALAEGEVLAYWWNDSQTPSTRLSAITGISSISPVNSWAGAESSNSENKIEPWPTEEPASFAECEQRLADAKARIANHKFQPKYSDSELVAMSKKGEVTDRFMVWVCEGDKSESDVVGYRREDTGRTTAWTAPFVMVEDADLDPEFICLKNGMIYKPEKSYTMVIIDRSVPLPDSKESLVIIPTFSAMAELGAKEFRDDGFSQFALRRAMTPAANGLYKVKFAQLASGLAEFRMVFDAKIAGQFAEANLPKQDAEVFRARHRYQIQFGANQHFRGTGLTGQLPHKDHPGTHKEHGALETMTLEHNPPSIAMRKAAGGVKVLSIPPKPVTQ